MESSGEGISYVMKPYSFTGRYTCAYIPVAQRRRIYTAVRDFPFSKHTVKQWGATTLMGENVHCHNTKETRTKLYHIKNSMF